MTPDEIDAVVEAEYDAIAGCALRWDGLRDQLGEMRRVLALHGPEPMRHLPIERPSRAETSLVEAWLEVHVTRGEDDSNDDLLFAHLTAGGVADAATAAALLRYFGDRARSAALPVARRLKTGGHGGLSHAFGLTAIHWGLHRWTVPDALAIAASTGLLPGAPAPGFEDLCIQEGKGASDPVLFHAALVRAGVAIRFDHESGGQNDRLVGHFADATSGVFAPADLSQSPRRPAPGRPTHEEVDVAFRWNGARTTFAAAYLGDVVDSAAVARAINGALARAGRPERFFRVAEGDAGRFVFGDPATVARAREELLLFLDDGNGNVDEAEHARLKQRLLDALA